MAHILIDLSEVGIFLIEISSFCMTLVCIKSTKYLTNILNGENLDAIPLKLEMWEGCSWADSFST